MIMKKQYTTPSMKVTNVELDASLLAGSIQATDESGKQLQGMAGGIATETGSNIVEADARGFSVWED